MKSENSLQAAFKEIYLKGKWEGGFPETASGAGSTIESTAQIRTGLADLFAGGLLPRDVTILDAPCGDFNWFKEVKGYGKYIGVDIVEELVTENRLRYGSDKISFACGDITQDELPAADTLLCRDCLIHLTNSMVFAFLENFTRQAIPFLLLTSHVNATNEDLAVAGGYRPLNFALPPFNFPEPLARIPDHLGQFHKYVCLWTSTQISQALATHG